MEGRDGDEALFYRGLMLAALEGPEPALDVLERIEGWSVSPFLHFGNRSLRYHFPSILGPLREAPRFAALLERIDRAWGVRSA